ncbi:MAG: dihydrofolate reductase [Weeksellaceae bacterium]
MNAPHISIVAAIGAKDRALGKDNKIPWRIREDLIHLKTLTKDQVVILGRKSYDSMAWYYGKSGNPMPGKLYIIITRNKNYEPTIGNTLVVGSIEEGLQNVKKNNISNAYVIGGAEIFKMALPYVDTLYLTLVKGAYEADTFFPEYNDFVMIEQSDWKEENGFQYSFTTLIKKTNATA